MGGKILDLLIYIVYIIWIEIMVKINKNLKGWVKVFSSVSYM